MLRWCYFLEEHETIVRYGSALEVHRPFTQHILLASASLEYILSQNTSPNQRKRWDIEPLYAKQIMKHASPHIENNPKACEGWSSQSNPFQSGPPGILPDQNIPACSFSYFHSYVQLLHTCAGKKKHQSPNVAVYS